MDQEEIVRTLPAVRQDFESLKGSLRDGRMHAACRQLSGACLGWGERLQAIYHHEDRAALAGRDPLTRFFVTRFRGMPEPASVADAPPPAMFLMAFTAFPYLDALMDESVIGDDCGQDADGGRLVRRLTAGEDDGSTLPVSRNGAGWSFDLMPLYLTKAAALESFIDEGFQGDFDTFLWRYVADHDLVFDMDQAWRPLLAEA
jgi:hypothetical protein